jgi:hypothetical protein
VGVCKACCGDVTKHRTNTKHVKELIETMYVREEEEYINAYMNLHTH